MRIPNISQTGVSGAEQISLGAISSAHQGRTKVYSALTKVVSDYQAKVTKAETGEEYNRLANGFARDTGEAWTSIQDEARLDENGAPNYSQLMDKYNKVHDTIAKDYNSRVQFQPNKAAMSQYIDSTLTSNTNAVRGEVGRRQVSHLLGGYEKQKIDMMGQDNGLALFQQAQLDALNTGIISEAKQASDYDAFQQEHETNRILDEFNVQRDLGFQETTGADYIGGIEWPPTFDDGEILRMSEKMEQDLRGDASKVLQAENKAIRDANALETTNWNVAKKAITMLTSGQKIADSMLEEINTNTSKLTKTEHVDEMELSVEVYHNMQALMSMTQADRTIALSSTYKANVSNDNYDLNQSTQRAYKAIESTIKVDPHQAHVMYAGGTVVPPITADNLGESLIAIQENHSNVAAWLGTSEAMTPQLSLAQLQQIKRVGVAGLDDILMAYGEKDAGRLINLLYAKDDGHDGSEMAIVGSIALQPDGVQSYGTYLAGDKLIQGNPDWALTTKLSTTGESPRELFFKATDGLFKFESSVANDKMSKAMQMVADKMYVQLASQAGMMAGTKEIDVDLYNMAVTLAVGKIEEYNGNKLLMPARDWTLGDLEDSFEGLSKEDVDSMGGFEATFKNGPRGTESIVTQEDILRKIADGDADLVQDSEIGHYQIWINGRHVNSKSGTPFILKLSEKKDAALYRTSAR